MPWYIPKFLAMHLKVKVVLYQKIMTFTSILDYFQIKCLFIVFSDCDITSGHLSTVVYSDHENGRQDNNLEGKVITMGPNSTHVNQVGSIS